TGGLEESGTVYRNYGRSLQAANMTRAAITNYLNALNDYEKSPKKYPADVLADIYMGLGDAYLSERRYGEGIETYRKALPYVSDKEGKKWLLSRIGKGYEGLEDSSAAEKNFSQLKEPAEGEFWPKVADYFIGKGKPLAKAGNVK
ncbi:MAG: hypothetical protein L7F78_08895, partial [Syntrophales bacterium LBB04]|nr:hypothetical protein [Syntrophales bacterium LBB04]